MNIDKKLLHRIFLLIAGGIAFGWLLLDTSRAKAVFDAVWGLISPFVAGAGIAFVFNVPMRSIENQLDGIHKAGLRRGLATVCLTEIFRQAQQSAIVRNAHAINHGEMPMSGGRDGDFFIMKKHGAQDVIATVVELSVETRGYG